MTPKIITISSKVQDHQHAVRKRKRHKTISKKKYLGMEFNYKEF